jgi:hypothetical protein
MKLYFLLPDSDLPDDFDPPELLTLPELRDPPELRELTELLRLLLLLEEEPNELLRLLLLEEELTELLRGAEERFETTLSDVCLETGALTFDSDRFTIFPLLVRELVVTVLLLPLPLLS